MTECFEVPAAVSSAAWVPPDHDAAPASAEDLRRAFRRHATATAVVTADSASGGPVGFTASSLASVSADPPLLSFNIATTSSSWPAVSLAAHLAVHVLAADQSDVARRFATHGIDRFAAPTRWRTGPYRVPLLDGVAATFVVTTVQRFRAGDHVIVVARVLHTAYDPAAQPLVHHDGEFHALRPARPRRGRRG